MRLFIIFKKKPLLKRSLRNISSWGFIAVTIFYIITRWLIFKGFNGTDDLHYAMLAARMIQGTYNPFQPGDIFSGRMLLIASQAAIYKIAGINVITTQALSLLVIIVSCYLTVFKTLPAKNTVLTLITSCLFYFNPVITYLTVGVMGDIYVMLSGILICIAMKSWILHIKTIGRSVIRGALIALLISLSLLYKETILVFLPFVCIVAFLYCKSDAKHLIAGLLTSFTFIIAIYGYVYYHYTGDAFFKISQIRNSSYLHHCSYDLLPFKYLLIRLTYGVWQEFIVQGFYPVIFGAFISIVALYKKRNILSLKNFHIVFFLILLINCLYFPFSLKGYQPLCSDARQFIMMLPLGAVITGNFITEQIALNNRKNIFIFIALCILAICVSSTGNKWQWMIYSLALIYAIAISGFVKLPSLIKTFAFCGILWLSILEHLFFKNSNWFYNMVELDKQISAKYYYFPDHDNMMHWQLLHHFDNKNFSYQNLEKNPFKIFKIYYQNRDSTAFHAGWLIINKSYTIRSGTFLNRIDSLHQKKYFTREVVVGDMRAVLVDKRESFTYIKTIIQQDAVR